MTDELITMNIVRLSIIILRWVNNTKMPNMKIYYA